MFHDVTDIHTDGHCNDMTESAKWADSVKILRLFTFFLLLAFFVGGEFAKQVAVYLSLFKFD